MFLLFTIVSGITLTLSASVPAVTKLNKSQSVAELIKSSDISESKLGIVYPYETSQNTYIYCSSQPEKSSEFRNLSPAIEIYDCYPSNFLNSTPATVDYLDKTNVPISFLLQPKENYTSNHFEQMYNFDLLVGGTDKNSNPEDIYINTQYADKLLIDNGLSSYKDLLDLEIELPYTSKYSKGIQFHYVIKGVIDESSEKYTYYKSFIGDFFLANAYLSLPISTGTIFKMPDTLNDIRKTLDMLFSIYDYQTYGRYFNALSFSLAYDYRISIIGTVSSENNIHEINNSENGFFTKFHNLYDYYLYKKYIIHFITTLILLLIFIIINSVLSRQIITKLKSHLKTVIISLLLSFALGLGFNFVYKAMFLRKTYISITSWQSFIAMFVCFIIIAFIAYQQHKRSISQK